MTEDLSPAAYARAIDDARQRFLGFVQRCTDGEWREAPVDGDPRPAGVIADHVAHAYEYLAGYVADLVAGKDVAISPEIIDAANAEHAADAAGVTPAHVAGHLRSSGDALIALVAGLRPDQLDLGDGLVRRLAVIAARHADDHRDQLQAGWPPPPDRMPRANDDVAALLREYAELLQIAGGDAFRARNYEKAAKSVAGYSRDISGLGQAGLRAIPGVGASIAEKITEYQRTGTIARLEDLRASIPDGVRELTQIPALGPKRAMQLYSELGVGSVAELSQAIDDGRLRDLKGFGPRSEDKLRHGIELARSLSQRVPLDVATAVAQRVVAAISAVPGCERCEHAGSLRRFRETIGDVDVLAAATDSGPLMQAITDLPEVTEVIARGETKTSVRISTGWRAQPLMQVDLRVVPPGCWGAAMQYFTGSQAHNVAVREIAVRKKLRLSEYGLFDVASGDLITSATEEDVYGRLGMAWVPPPLREDTGEVRAALRGELPDLVQAGDVRGDLHVHTNLTDGVGTLEEMVLAARARGYEYVAITDHAPDLFMQRMTLDKMLAQRHELAVLAERLAGDGGPPIALLHGTELNIGPDGSVDWPEEILAGFDLCVASVHSHFDQPRAEMTRRFLRACENPRVHVIGHPSARRIGKRPPVDVDFAELFRACAQTGTALEINASPGRLDLSSDHIRAARDAGVVFAIDTDAHAVRHLDFLRYGVGTAQRGWLTAGDVINTWPLDRLRAFLRSPRLSGFPRATQQHRTGGV